MYYYGFDNVVSSVKEYRIGDTFVLIGIWIEYVFCLYGVYMCLSVLSGVYVL